MLSLPQLIESRCLTIKDIATTARTPRKAESFSVPPRTLVVWIAILAGITLLMLFKDRMEQPGDLLTQPVFQQLVESNLIAQATINYNSQNSDLREVSGKYWKTPEHKVEAPFRAKVRLLPDLEKKLLSQCRNVDVARAEHDAVELPGERAADHRHCRA